MAWFYDNRFDVHPQLEEVVCVDRVYCLPVLYYLDEEWEELGSIFQNLPGFLGRGITPLTYCLPFWFGYEVNDDDIFRFEDESGIYLCASSEPSGLQISGNVRLEDWLEWTQRFEEQAGKLRHFEV